MISDEDRETTGNHFPDEDIPYAHVGPKRVSGRDGRNAKASCVDWSSGI